MRKVVLFILLGGLVGFLIGILYLYTQSFSVVSIPLEKVIESQKLGQVFLNPGKYAVRAALLSGIPANTIVLLILLPVVAAFIAGARHIVGLRGFGIFLPAALSVVFVAIGPLPGFGLFLLIVIVSTFVRLFLRSAKVRLQYLPRTAFIFWAVVVSLLMILFFAPLFEEINLSRFDIFPVLILVLLTEDFMRVQLGKSAKTAINITAETLLVAFISYLILTFRPFQEFAILNPEILLISVAVTDFIVGKYIGLRFLEFWRFRKLINS